MTTPQTLDDLLTLFDRAVVERWALAGYRAHMRRKGVGGTGTRISALNDVIRTLTPDQIEALRETVCRLASAPPPTTLDKNENSE